MCKKSLIDCFSIIGGADSISLQDLPCQLIHLNFKQVSTSGVDKAKGKGSLADKPKIVPTVFNSHSLVYVGSLILLGLAVLVRLFQLVNWSGYASMANRS